ncbi:RAN GTPase-activating protein 1 [Andrographis paniculata]|uniref:RAN GTPase-activating protein 1 n=1 Tax=Andrographis paniculata TaxID=175694 RepID=UPI0021E81247|nr:RAN GTPase-activating protein 1 [Andrographis paniculata]
MEIPAMSVKLWPPSQATRLKLVERMTKNLVTPSIWSRKYGLLSEKEAEEDAKEIEAAAFDIANQHFAKEPDGDGCSAIQLYAKESSRLMIEVIKRGPIAKVEADLGILTKIKGSEGTSFDISGNPRKEIDAGDAEKLFKALKESGVKYTKICFSNTSFGREAALVAEPVLSSIKEQLTEIDLSDFVAGRNEEEALDVMKIFSSALEGTKLRYLNLSNNALGEKGIRAFEPLLKSQDNLEELYLINDGISEEAAEAVLELIPSTNNLKILHFHNNMTGDEGAVAISKMVRNSAALEDFRCSSTRVGSDGGIALAKALGSCNRLKKLDLTDNMFGVEAGLALSKASSAFSNLTEIYLTYLNLEDEGSIAILNALRESASSLEVLDMAGNEITAKSAPALASCIASKQFLSILNLGENELKDEGAILIAKALEEGHGQLIEVDVNTNLIRRAGARRLCQAVVKKPGFKLLNINGNYISDEGIDEVKDLFKNCPDVLGPLDGNDPDGDEYDDDEHDVKVRDGGGDEHELESKLKGLEIKHGE